MSQQQRSGEDGGGKRPVASPWEWVVAAVSSVLVLGSIGFMLHQALSQPDTPPRIVVTADTVVAQDRGFLVRFRARNDGNSTAAGVTVEGELRSDTGTVQVSAATLDYVPAGAQRHGGLFFTHDPRHHVLTLRATGYERP